MPLRISFGWAPNVVLQELSMGDVEQLFVLAAVRHSSVGFAILYPDRVLLTGRVHGTGKP